jgi:hypothetical protein
LENLQTHSKLTKKSLLDVIFQFFLKKKEEKNEFGEPPNSLQTLSKLKKKYAFTTFFLKKICVQPLKKTQKKVVNAYFF